MTGSSPEQPALDPRVTRILSGTALVTAFGILAVFNSGGYRYGASDQAFYVPAIMRHVNPALFPRDRVLISVQDDLLLVTRLLGTIVTATGATVANVVFGAYLIMLLAVAGAGWLFGRALLATRWGAAALVLAMSIRHRVPKTGVNTLEHYFQPRMIAFAVGSAGLAALVRQRTWLALALAFGAGLVHPTTGLWFSVVVAGGAVVSFPEERRILLILGSAAAVVAASVFYWGALAGRLVTMDAEWLQSLATKDYLFPNQWSVETWLQHALYLVVIAVSFYARRRLALAGRGEHALVAGLLAMLLALGVSLPAVSARIALAVQLQVSRAMWLFDLLAVAYVVWWLVEAPWTRARQDARAVSAGDIRPRANTATPTGSAARRWAVAVVALGALVRGSYVMFVEKAGAPPIRVNLAPDAWRDAMDWLRAQPLGVQVLADPGHAWRYGSSVRIAAGRDVFLEEVKDAAIGMYSRDVAMRVLTRTRAIDDFTALTPSRARALAREYDIDYLVTEARLDLPVAYGNGKFRIYRLR